MYLVSLRCAWILRCGGRSSKAVGKWHCMAQWRSYAWARGRALSAPLEMWSVFFCSALCSRFTRSKQADKTQFVDLTTVTFKIANAASIIIIISIHAIGIQHSVTLTDKVSAVFLLIYVGDRFGQNPRRLRCFSENDSSTYDQRFCTVCYTLSQRTPTQTFVC